MYHNHEISTDAYNKGKEEYKNEIQKYRDALKSGNQVGNVKAGDHNPAP